LYSSLVVIILKYVSLWKTHSLTRIRCNSVFCSITDSTYALAHLLIYCLSKRQDFLRHQIPPSIYRKLETRRLEAGGLETRGPGDPEAGGRSPETRRPETRRLVPGGQSLETRRLEPGGRRPEAWRPGGRRPEAGGLETRRPVDWRPGGRRPGDPEAGRPEAWRPGDPEAGGLEDGDLETR